MSDTWNGELMRLLEKIRVNSYVLSEKHRKRFIQYSSWSKYFDLPVIVCSVFSSSFASLGAVPSSESAMITTSISMFIAILTSMKLYLNLSSNINDEISLSKDFYILSVSIYKMIRLKEEDRKITPLDFLNQSYSAYVKLIETSSLLQHSMKKDELAEVNVSDYLSLKSTSSSSLESNNVLLNENTEV